MNVSLTSKLESLIKHKVESGMYHSASEVIREALRLLEERDAVQAVKLEALRQDIKAGMESLDNGRGRGLDVERIKARGRQERERKRR